MGERKPRIGTREVERTTGSHEALDRLFVYGTLRAGQTARSLVANQITRSVKATTRGAIFAFPMGYPGFVDDETGIVHGDVVWLTELPATFGLLDAYEGQDFSRMIRPVTLETGQEIWAWIYVLSDPATALAWA